MKELNRRAIAIFGPEHTGTKALLNLLIDGFGATGKKHNCGHELVTERSELYAFKYSVPSGHQGEGPWPSPKKILQDVMLHNYQDIRVLIPVRDYWCLYNSHCWNPKNVASGHEQRRRRNFDMVIAQGYRNIINDVQEAGVPFYFTSYESMVTDPQRFLFGLSQTLELPVLSTGVKVFDGNEQYSKLVRMETAMKREEK
tara:strand:- start:136 stop:732 length:597 start_codon:yes stop_codon:yes gene_type:complete